MTHAFILFCFLLLSSSAHAGLVTDDFQQYPQGKFPSSWRTWPFQRGRATDVYTVRAEGENRFLAADDSADISVQILRNFYWKIDSYPKLSWRWRARTLPLGANETNPAVNDSACGVYVVISKTRQEMLKYTWSTTAPIGAVYEKRPGKAYIIVAETGGKKAGQWQSHTVNVVEDYKKYFGRELDKDPAGIAILTDGNATHTPSACDYDDFAIEQ